MRLLFNILKSVVQLKLQCTPCSLPNWWKQFEEFVEDILGLHPSQPHK
jgi:hypothetical protein